MASPHRSIWRLLAPDIELCSALDPAAQPRLDALNAAMQAFYNSDIAGEYFAAADAANEEWQPSFTGHWHLLDAIPEGSRVVDLGCGTAYVSRHFAKRKVSYTGVDWSDAQILRNRERMPESTFHVASLDRVPLPDQAFDAAVSFYTIEHLVWPHRVLDEMFRLTRPGGLIALLFPPFRIGSSLKSFDYGLSVRRFKDKVRSLSLVDVALHVYQHRVFYPLYLRHHHPRGDSAQRFLINLKPVCLQYRGWFPDADAVHLADTAEIRAYLAARGADTLVEQPRYAYLLMKRRAV